MNFLLNSIKVTYLSLMAMILGPCDWLFVQETWLNPVVVQQIVLKSA